MHTEIETLLEMYTAHSNVLSIMCYDDDICPAAGVTNKRYDICTRLSISNIDGIAGTFLQGH